MIADVLANAATSFGDIEVPQAGNGNHRRLQAMQHAGQFSDDEIEKIVIKEPSVLLTVLSWTRLPSSKQLAGRPYQVTFAAVAAAIHGVPVYRRAQLIAVAVSITRILEKQRWGLDDNKITAAQLLTSRNLYSLAAQRKGVSLWAITWTHEMEFLGDMTLPTQYLLEAVEGKTDVHGSLDTTLEMESSTEPQHGNLQDELNV